jgi:malonyl-CoA/methylmalonyl-CoA synthetase
VTLLDLLAASTAERGAALAVNDVSYNDLVAGSVRVGAALAQRGVRAGDRVALFCENRLAFVFAYLAVLRLGAIVVPANVLYRASDLAHVLADADVSCVIASAQTRPHLTGLAVPPVIAAEDVERWASDTASSADDASERSWPIPEPDAPALIVYTSGTTGRSKGAVLTHANLAVIAVQVTSAWRWTANDTLAIALPLFHVHGLCAALNGTLCSGGRLMLHERFDAATMFAQLQEPGVTMFFGVPTMYVRLLELPEPVEFPALRLCVCGSAALSADLFARFATRFGITILERYGATEFGFALGNRFAGPRVAGSVGIPLPGVRVRIDGGTGGDGGGGNGDGGGDTGNDGDAGRVGELLVSGPNVFAGYWRNDMATRTAFVIDDGGTRWYRSGDLASYDPAQQVYRIVGRLKDLIISGGFNVYPLEVEAEIERYPGVRASAVVGAPDPVRGESVVAFIESDPADACDPDALIAWLRPRLASFKIPKRVTVIDALPRNALGKVEKTKLRALG